MPKPTRFLITSARSKVYHATRPKELPFGGDTVYDAKCNKGLLGGDIVEVPAIPSHLRLCRKCAHVYYD